MKYQTEDLTQDLNKKFIRVSTIEESIRRLKIIHDDLDKIKKINEQLEKKSQQ